MTNKEYQRLLRALAAKHLAVRTDRPGPYPSGDPLYLLNKQAGLRKDLKEISDIARQFNAIDRHDDLDRLRRQLSQTSPIEQTKEALEDTGILNALEDAGQVVFREMRREAVPQEDYQLLSAAGFTNDEIEILLASAIHDAQLGKVYPRDLSHQLDEASAIFNTTVVQLQAQPSEPKKRKIFNGIGKILGGSVAGVGNALMAAGTIVAPNPATGAGALACAAVALPLIFGGIGDLRGE
jgi:hypothetical protein